MIRGIDVTFLHSPNFSDLTRWYSEVLGLKTGYGDGHWQEFAMSDGSRFAIDAGSDEPSEVERQPIVVSFRVDDIAGVVAELVAKGVAFYPDVRNAIHDVGPTLVATFRDPEGRWMQLSQRKSP